MNCCVKQFVIEKKVMNSKFLIKLLFIKLIVEAFESVLFFLCFDPTLISLGRRSEAQKLSKFPKFLQMECID